MQALPLLFVLCAAAAPAQDSAVILRPDAIVLPDGQLQAGGAVLLRGDRILAAGADVPVPARAVEVSLSGVLAPGFVDAFARVGVDSGLAEHSRVATPRLRASDSLDYDSEDWQRWVEQGVTAVQIVPDPLNAAGRDPWNVLAGWTSVVTCDPGGPQLLRPTGRQTLVALSHTSQASRGGPTSLAGSLELLAISVPRHLDLMERRGALAFVDSAEGIAGVQALAEEHSFDVHWLSVGDIGSYGGKLRGALVGVPALQEGQATPRLLESLRRLHEAGARIVFGTRQARGRSAPASLRSSAMIYSRATNDPAAALAAITSSASQFAAMSPAAGRISAGARADLVLWSGHPLDASSSVRSVMIGGRTVHFAPSQEAQ